MSDSPASYQTALQVAQAAIQHLATWAGVDLGQKCAEDSAAIERAKELLPWNTANKFQPLSVLFDQIQLTDDKTQDKKHYWDAIAIEDADPKIPYPQTEKPNLDQLKRDIKPVLESFLPGNWENLSLLTLILEKYGSFISLDGSNVAFFDLVRATAAIASALAEDPEAEYLSLVAGDLSGIQDFIYTISSEGALKSLRARSFYLELVTEEVVQQVLSKLKLPRTSVIYAGGGNLYMLAPGTKQTEKAIVSVRDEFNQWLLKEFQGKVFLALTCKNFPTPDVANQEFAEHWKAVVQKLAEQKVRKFDRQISNGDVLKIRPSYEKCRVCHRDDQRKLKPLSTDSGSVEACSTCHRMMRLGRQLFQSHAIVRSHEKAVSDKRLRFKLSSGTVYYSLFDTPDQAIQAADDHEILLINNWEINHYQANRTFLLLLGNYAKESEISKESEDDRNETSVFIRAEEMTEAAKKQGCIPRVGYLRMDVDRLGEIFAKGLVKEDKQPVDATDIYFLPKIASLSRQMSYFFKVYLNSLAKNRSNEFLNQPEQLKFKFLTQSDRQNLLFIYAGGDDLFVSGAWNEVVEFAFDIYQSFRAYTGYHSDITISGGISLSEVKYPLYQAANDSGEAEKKAKGNGRDSLGLFGSAFKWSEWIGTHKSDKNFEKQKQEILQIVRGADKEYWNQEPPNISYLFLLGVLPFVQQIQQKQHYSRSFIRNLLIAAQNQEQKIKEIEEKRKLPEYKYQVQDIRYYLHLPQIAYTLARSPEIAKDQDLRQSLLSPYNAPYFRAIATWIELLNRKS